MRYAEFKLYEAEGQPGYYTIGDSHAKGVADGAGKPWINLAIGGKQANDPGVLANVSKITPGSVVVVAAGANDTANSYKAANKDPKRVVPPATIAGRVAALVNAVRAQRPSKVILLVFPNGEGRTTGMAQWYNGDYQEQVRTAIMNTVQADHVVDQNDFPISPDKIHLQWGAYVQIGRDLAKKFPLKAGAAATVLPSDRLSITPNSNIAGKPSAEPASTDTNKKASEGEQLTSIDVPQTSLGYKGPEIMDLQKVLVALGYDVGITGTDGIRGKYTKSAIKKYQADRGLEVDGDPGPETVAAINKDIKANPKKVAGLKKSRPEEVKQSARIGGEYAPQPVAYDAVTKGKIGEVLNFVAAPESRGYYDMMFGGQRRPEILTMTIAKANRFQEAWGKRAGSSAMGRYQIMHFNTIDYARKAGLNPNKDLFSEENQDKMGIVFLQEKGLDQWLNGKLSDKQFLEGLSRVWAGLPSPSKGGNSYYGGVGLNRHQTQVSMNTALNALQNIKAV